MAAQDQQKRDFAGYRLRAVPPNTRESPSRRQRPLPPCVENRCFEDLAGSDEDVADIASEASEYLGITESRGTVASADQRSCSWCQEQPGWEKTGHFVGTDVEHSRGGRNVANHVK